MQIRELQYLLTNGFNPYIDIENSDKVLIHLCEEIGELCKANRKGENIDSELGDVLILLCFYASSIHLDLEDVTIKKIKENIRIGKFGGKINE